MSQMLNVRVDETLVAAIDLSAQAAGVSRSVWMREALAGAAAGMAGPAHPSRALSLQAAKTASRTTRNRCQHPPTARQMLPYSERCTICGETTRRL